MKVIQCELCGSGELVKTDGYFVCQHCGTKYTLEEARKLMIEGVVEVSGTIKIDKSEEIDKLLKNADITYSDGNYKEAYELYSKLLSSDPDNAHAILYRSLSSAWQSSVKDCRITEINNAGKRAIIVKHNECGDSKEYFDFCIDALAQLSKLLTGIYNMFVTFENDAMPVNLTLTGAIATAGIAAEVSATAKTGAANCCIAGSNIVRAVLDNATKYDDARKLFWSNIETVLNNCQIYAKHVGINDDFGISALLEEFKTLKDENIRKFYIKYPEERSVLESEKIEYQKILTAADAIINSIPTYAVTDDLTRRKENAEIVRKYKRKIDEINHILDISKNDYYIIPTDFTKYEVEGNGVQPALDYICDKFGCTENDFEVEVIREGKKNMLVNKTIIIKIKAK